MKRIVLAAIVFSFSLCARGADISKIVQDTQRLAQSPEKITLVWWIPSEFWDVALRDNPNVTDAVRVQFIKVIEDYLVVVVVSADIGPMGGFTPKDRAAVEAGTELIVDGATIAPLATDKVSPDALNFVTMMKPVLENTLGQLGKGMEFLIYPNPPHGDTKISVMDKGGFSYMAFGNSFSFRTPIGSFLPAKIDVNTGDIFPGDYMYNPYSGAALLVKPAESAAPANAPVPHD